MSQIVIPGKEKNNAMHKSRNIKIPDGKIHYNLVATILIAIKYHKEKHLSDDIFLQHHALVYPKYNPNTCGSPKNHNLCRNA